MKVLGLNGFGSNWHDASACLLVDGRLMAFSEEERFSRIKHGRDAYPRASAAFCLNAAGLTLDDIDAIAFGWDIPEFLKALGGKWHLNDEETLALILPRDMFGYSNAPHFHFVPHHLAHAASAYYFSGDSDAAILVVDGQGEKESITLARGHQNRIEILESLPTFCSIGWFYDAVCQYCGFGRDDQGKLMGLAAYGEVQDPTFGVFQFNPVFRVHSLRGVDLNGGHLPPSVVFPAWLDHLGRVARLPRNPLRAVFNIASGHMVLEPARDPFQYRDLAASAQAAIEHAIMSLVDILLDETGVSTLHLAGGVALNASANGKLINHPRIRKLFVQPIAHDAGASLGAAALIAATEGGDRIEPMKGSAAWGPSLSAEYIRKALDCASLGYSEPADLVEAVVDFLNDGLVVGWFQGRAEGGPRALGHRSILGLPDDVRMRDFINAQVKNREWWRPLAPSIDERWAGEILERDYALPYMIVAAPVNRQYQAKLSAVVHVDGTTRPQTVTPASDSLYSALLERIGASTGIPAVLNTSLNRRGEPIVNTAQEAINTFCATNMAALAIGPYLATKKRPISCRMKTEHSQQG